VGKEDPANQAWFTRTKETITTHRGMRVQRYKGSFQTYLGETALYPRLYSHFESLDAPRPILCVGHHPVPRDVRALRQEVPNL
jgi:hypothetical protein